MADLKKCFYQAIGNHFLAKSKDVAMAIQSASCEQWINTEIMLALNSKDHGCLQEEEYAVNEALGKVDVVIFNDPDRKYKNARQMIEVKLVYPLGGEQEIRRKLTNLCEKMYVIKARCKYYCIGTRVGIHGLVFTVWHDGYAVTWREHARMVKNEMKTVFPTSEFTTQHDYAVESKSLFDGTSILLGECERKIMVGATMFSLR